jgi:hypothetical protein
VFRINPNGKKHLGQVIFIKDEDTFDFEPSRNADITLLNKNLYIGFDSETMIAQQVWGFCPRARWLNKELKVPLTLDGQLILSENIEAGISKNLTKNWTVNFDSKIGWVCIGDDSFSQNDVAIEFAANIIAILDRDKLKAIWLKPNFIN